MTQAPHHLVAVWGGATDDVWIVADTGEMYHYNGNGWSEVENELLPTAAPDCALPH